MNPKKVTCCVWDGGGIFLSWAFTLSRFFDRVLYTTDWRGAYTRSKKLIIGDGFEEFERIQNPLDYVDQVGLWCFPDVGAGDVQEHLRSLGKLVWGSGHAEELELNRWKSRQMLEKLGMLTNNVEKIVSTGKLREYLKANDSKVVKISTRRGSTRGDMESWKHDRYDLSETRIDELEYRLGAAKHVAIFTVEDVIDSEVEIGYDGYIVDGEFPDIAAYGYELKDSAYAGRVCKSNELPKVLREANETLAPKFKGYKYRGWYSDEIRLAKDRTPYLIDFTCRSASPAGEPWQECYLNWDEILLLGANGELVDPKPAKKYGVQAMIKSPWANKDWCSVFFPEKIARYVKLLNACKVKDTIHIVPLNEDLIEIGSVVGLGDTLKEAIDHCKQSAKLIEGYQLDIKLDALDDAQIEAEKGEQYGIKF